MKRIRLENVTKEFGRVTALHQLSLEVESGEMMVLLGPSGCGKSTTLRLVAGLDSLTAGRIYIDDRRIDDVPPQERDVAMVFQNYALYPHMTVADNIGYPLRVRKLSRQKIQEQVLQVARKLEIDSLLDRRPRQLSGGQRQRVALARAIIRQPVAFLMDEPLSNLDANLRLQMRAELKRLQQELGTTTLYVTHDHAEAMTLARRIAVLRDGNLHQVGTPMDLYCRPANQFVAGFLGTPPMNFLQGTVEDGSFRFPGGAIQLSPEQVRSAASVRTLVLGFRPQAASLVPAGGDATLCGRVYVTEEMGNETVVVLTCGENRLTVTAPSHVRPAVGESLGLALAPEALHFFDGPGGRTLISGGKQNS